MIVHALTNFRGGDCNNQKQMQMSEWINKSITLGLTLS